MSWLGSYSAKPPVSPPHCKEDGGESSPYWSVLRDVPHKLRGFLVQARTIPIVGTF